MTATSRWTRKQTSLALGVLVAAACATPTEGFVESEVAPPGFGDDAAGTSATGGTLDAMMSVGGTSGAVTGTGGTTGGTGTGGTTGGTGTGGTGGTATGGAGTGGTTGGMGGTGKAGTSSGKGGASAGMTAAGGKAGRAGRGAAGAGGTGGSGTATSGCAKLSVPMNGATDKAHFVISLRSATDLSAAGTTISIHAYVEAGIGGVILPFAQDGSFNFLGPAKKPLLADQDGWVTLTWDIGAEPTVAPALMKKSVSRIGIEIKAAPSATWSNPTVVYVDSISVSTTPALSFPFATTSTVSTMAQSSDPTGQTLWLNSGSTDTTATGSALSWVATCP